MNDISVLAMGISLKKFIDFCKPTVYGKDFTTENNLSISRKKRAKF